MSASWNFETFCIFWTPTSQLCYQCVWFLSPIIVPRQAAGRQALAVQFWTSDNTPTRGARFTRHPEAVTTYKMHISPTLSAKTVKIPPTDSGHAGRHHKTVGLSTNSGSINVPEMPLLAWHVLIIKPQSALRIRNGFASFSIHQPGKTTHCDSLQ